MQVNSNPDSLFSTATEAPAAKELDREAFLTLLVSQLRHQDPLEPVQNEDFVAQLATFSSLEQLEGVNDGITGLMFLQQADSITGQLADGSALIGKQVGWIDPSTQLEGSGQVESVKVVNGLTTVTVAGQSVPLYWIDSVEPAPAATGGDEAGGSDDDQPSA
jgi:flagellar basal-body rod modification protein FlgD